MMWPTALTFSSLSYSLLAFSLLSFLPYPASPAKIAVVSYNLGTSHTLFAGAIADTLVDAGHIVHFFSIEQDLAVKINGSLKAHRNFFLPSRSRNIWNDMSFRLNPFRPFNIETPSFFVNVTEAFDQSCHDVLESRDLLEALRSEKYDIGISEAYGFHGFGLLNILGVREYVLASAIPLQPSHAAFFNIPQPASYVTSCLDGEGSLATPNLSYFHRIYNTALQALNYWFYERVATKNTAIFRSAYPKMPDLLSLVRSAGLILVNTPPLLDLPRPTSHKVLNIGGLERVDHEKQLPGEILAVLNGTASRVVIVSFGTLARTVFIEGPLLNSFMTAFSRFPDYDFLWKFDEIEENGAIFRRHPNVHPFRWLPQKQILNHPNTRGFISHMGLNSLMEAAKAGVPMVSIPLFTDQQYNTNVALQKGIGVYVDKTNITAESITEALKSILHDSSFSYNAQLVRAQLAAFPRQPAEELVRFIKYIDRFGAPSGGSFDLPDQSFVVALSLDIYIPLAVAATAAAAVLIGLYIWTLEDGLDLLLIRLAIHIEGVDALIEILNLIRTRLLHAIVPWCDHLPGGELKQKSL